MTLTTEPVAARPTRSARMLGPVLTIAGLTGATVALHLRDPHVSHSWGVCPLYALTGIYCPGCGGLRAVNDLTDGHLGAAASSNLLFIVVLPVLVFLLGRWAVERWPGGVGQPDSRRIAIFLVTVGVAALVFTVLRNLPAGSWLA